MNPSSVQTNKKSDRAVFGSKSEEDKISSPIPTPSSPERNNRTLSYYTGNKNNTNVSPIFKPSPADVLLGRGKPFQSHPGNRLMLDLVDTDRANYFKAERRGKHLLVETVMKRIQAHGGRFLSKVDYENYWVEVSNSIAYRKVGHAFRSKARCSIGDRATSFKSSSPKISSSDQGSNLQDRLSELMTATTPPLGPVKGEREGFTRNCMASFGKVPELPVTMPMATKGAPAPSFIRANFLLHRSLMADCFPTFPFPPSPSTLPGMNQAAFDTNNALIRKQHQQIMIEKELMIRRHYAAATFQQSLHARHWQRLLAPVVDSPTLVAAARGRMPVVNPFL